MPLARATCTCYMPHPHPHPHATCHVHHATYMLHAPVTCACTSTSYMHMPIHIHMPHDMHTHMPMPMHMHMHIHMQRRVEKGVREGGGAGGQKGPRKRAPHLPRDLVECDREEQLRVLKHSLKGAARPTHRARQREWVGVRSRRARCWRAVRVICAAWWPPHPPHRPFAPPSAAPCPAPSSALRRRAQRCAIPCPLPPAALSGSVLSSSPPRRAPLSRP
eukprot:4224670-Prymnesium_polylepis.2